MPAHSTTSTIDSKAITNEEFYEQARRWAAIVRNQAKRNASAFRKGKNKPHIYKVSGKWKNPHPRIRRSMADWLDEPIDRNAEQLFDLAEEFWEDHCMVNFFGVKKQ